MGTGARSTEQWKEHRALLEAISRNNAHAEVAAPHAPPQAQLPEPVELPSRWREIAIGGLLGGIGVVWVAALVTSLQPEAAPLAEVARIVSLASGPLALLGIVFLLLQRTSRREARRFGQTAAAMRAEASGLEHVIGRLSDRIEDNRKSLAEHAHHLLLLGEDSTLRLAEIAAGMRSESSILSERGEQLEKAATVARSDMTALLGDIPKAEAQIVAIGGLLRDAGLDTHEQAAKLEAQLSALVARGRDADEVAGGAAQRLAAHLARIETGCEAAGQKMDDTAARMSTTIDGVLGSAAEAIDQTRRGLESQNAALLAMVEQGAAALDRAGTDATGKLGGQLDALTARLAAMGEQLTAQDARARALLDLLDQGIAGLETRLDTLDTAGGASAERLGTAVALLREHAETLTARFTDGETSTATLIERAAALREALALCNGELVTIEAQAVRGEVAVAAVAPKAAALEQAVRGAADKLSETDAVLIRQRAALDAIGTDAETRLDEIRAHAEALERMIGQAGESARLLADGAGPQLVEALLRVRETAVQAAERARDSLTAVIPEAATALAAASRDALDRALGEQVAGRIEEIAEIAERAVQAAQRASDRLMRQMLTIADTTAAVEARIAEARDAQAESDEDQFARRVALLIESLHSAAIDVTKILSNEVTDKAWAAYLKGDRGVFTRRAVRLIDATQAREIARHYDSEPEFREQVNRYVHDFESMLRRILAARDGAPLGVTLLSSDMGKLYVALAQAIERLRS